jgi:hypothetical protein
VAKFEFPNTTNRDSLAVVGEVVVVGIGLGITVGEFLAVGIGFGIAVVGEVVVVGIGFGIVVVGEVVVVGIGFGIVVGEFNNFLVNATPKVKGPFKSLSSLNSSFSLF